MTAPASDGPAFLKKLDACACIGTKNYKPNDRAYRSDPNKDEFFAYLVFPG